MLLDSQFSFLQSNIAAKIEVTYKCHSHKLTMVLQTGGMTSLTAGSTPPRTVLDVKEVPENSSFFETLSFSLILWTNEIKRICWMTSYGDMHWYRLGRTTFWLILIIFKHQGKDARRQMNTAKRPFLYLISCLTPKFLLWNWNRF